MPKLRYSFFMPVEDHGFVKKAQTYQRARLTEMGHVFVLIAFIGGTVSSPGLHISAYLVPSFTLTLLVCSLIFSYFFRPKVSAKRIFPSPVQAGEHMIYHVEVTNTGHRPIRNLHVSESVLPYGLYDASDHKNYSNIIHWLNPGEKKSVTLVVYCKLRGFYTFPLLLAGSDFPSGLVRSPRRCGSKENCFVYPKKIPQTSEKNFLLPGTESGKLAIHSQRRDADEFFSTREYQYGDRLRDVHWASYAKTGKLIVKEYIEKQSLQYGLFIDDHAPRSESDQSFEKRISIAADIVENLSQKGHRIGSFFTHKITKKFADHETKMNSTDCLESLTLIERVKKIDFQELEQTIKSNHSSSSSLIMILRDWNKNRIDFIHQLKKENFDLKIIVVHEKKLKSKPDQNVIVIQPQTKRSAA